MCQCTTDDYPDSVTLTAIDAFIVARFVVVQFARRPLFKIIEMIAKPLFGTVNRALYPTAGEADIERWIQGTCV